MSESRRVAPKLSILIVSFNTRDLTLTCLDSIRGQDTSLDLEVRVVDNASEDGSADAIRDEHPEVELTALDSNLGFGRATNLAASMATGGYLLCLNPDTVVLPGALDEIVEFARKNEQAGLWGGRTLNPDRSLNRMSCWSAPTPWSLFCSATGVAGLFEKSALFNPEGMGRWERDSVREVEVISGCFLLITRELWDRLGGFDERFFVYGEDVDLCLRARELGATPLIDPEAVIVHHAGASESVRSEKMIKLFRAKAQLLRKFSSPTRSALGVRMLDLWALERVVLFGLAAVWSSSAAEGYRQWKQVWRSRREWRREEATDPKA